MADDSMKELEKHILLRDQKLSNDFKVDSATLKYVSDVSQINLDCFEGLFVPYVSHLTVHLGAKRFMRDKFRLHPVRYFNDNALDRILNKAVINDPFELPEIYNSSSIMIDPFQIPRKYNLDSVFGGTLVTQAVVPDVDDKTLFELLKQLNIYFMAVKLPKKTTPIATMSYAHEITHSQLESQKGIIENYYNSEVLSIFVELLQAYEKNPNVFKINLANRIKYLIQVFDGIMRYKKFKDNSGILEATHHRNIGYFISTVEAFNLFYLYLSGDNNIKTYILDEIQRVFDGEFTVEEVLNHLGTTYEESLDSSYAGKLVKIAQQNSCFLK